MSKLLQGIYAPIPTPFDDKGDIAWGHLEKNMEFWCKSSLGGLVVMGSNGEMVALSESERKELITKACQSAKGKKPISAGCGCESTRETIAMCEHAAKAGAQTALVINPNYYKALTKDDMLRRFYLDVADASPIPVVVYNFPGNTGVNLSSSLVTSINSHPNICGVKDSGANIVQITEILRDAPDSFSVFAGSTSFLYATLALGGKGGTLALANVMPEECVRIQTFVNENKHAEAAKLQKQLIAINAAVTARFGIPGLKAAMEMIGLYGGAARKPLMPLPEEDRKTIQTILTKAQEDTRA